MACGRTKQVFVCGLVCLLAACRPPPKVVVEERSVRTVKQETEQLGGQLIRFVQPGDTLYSISFAHDLDVTKLAAWNGITDTGKLRVGQRIRLTEPLGFRADQAATRTSSRKASKSTSSPVAKAVNRSDKKTTSRSASDIKKANPRTTSPTTRSASIPKPVSRSGSSAAFTWIWPVQGTLIGTFNAGKGQQGIDIQASADQSVVAANRGEVVYVGNSLKGYGNLIIVKHSDVYLSAYAHNKAIYVREGQQVAQNQKIATVGRNNRRLHALHFQIRKHGKPVDPLQFLPRL